MQVADTAGMQVADAMVRQPKLCPPDVTVGQVQALLADPHVHAVLIVDAGRLVSVVERGDVVGLSSGDDPAAPWGRLAERTVSPAAPLAATHQQMLSTGRRRLAVVDGDRRLLGLLCLKATSTGFCSEQDVRARDGDGR